MKTTPTRPMLLALALAAVALPASAAKEAIVLSSYGITSWYNSDGSAMTSNGGGGNGNPARVFDGNFSNYQMFPRCGNNGYVIIDLSQNADAPAGGYKVTEVKVASTGKKAYSIYTTTDGSTWNAVDGAVNVKGTPSETTTYQVGTRATQVKYVFNEGSMWDYDTEYLAEIQVLGYDPTPPPAQVISNYGITSWFNSDGSAMASNGGGGNGNPARVFDGNFSNYQMFPRCGNNGYVIIDLTQNANAPENGYHVTEVKVASTGKKAYSIYTTTDGSTWNAVDGAVNVKGTPSETTTYQVGARATQVKYVFNEGSMWDYDTEYLAEIQVLGIDPADIDCDHPSWTEWQSVANSATCTEYGVEERFCMVCHERQEKSSTDAPPLGHDYVSTLTKAGSVDGYGTGAITCARCDFSIDCSKPVDLSKHGGEKVEGKTQFTEEEVSTTNHPEWGPSLKKIFDGDASSYWLAQSTNHTEFVSMSFGTRVELTKIDFAVRNHNQVLEFYDDDGTTEKFLKEVEIVQDENSGLDYQTKTVFFWSDDENGPTVKKLVVRFRDGIGLYMGGWGYPAGVTLHELHPYGTVVGAGMPEPSPMFLLMQ